ncbi:hypothetical protein [Chitinimonas sp.]|uniref:hypothetical protein n=1 Tax=Chitinimonas sp. TaxID=1934313 RepID=UPI002F9559A3
MDIDTANYVPINCEFHDLLEVHATRRKPVTLRFVGVDGRPQQRLVGVADVYSRGGAEYLALADGELIRLDRLIEVDGVLLADFEAGICAPAA